MKLQVKKCHLNAVLLHRATNKSAGLDLSNIEDVWLLPNEQLVIPTGLEIKLPINTYGRIAPRSG